jgi:hypothetical protein
VTAKLQCGQSALDILLLCRIGGIQEPCAVLVLRRRAEFYLGPNFAAHRPAQVARVAAAWGGTAWEAGPAEAEVHFPEAIREFVTLFDRGAFPDLEEGDE